MAHRLHEQIAEIKKMILTLGDRVERMVENAVLAVENRDTKLAAKIIEEDEAIDQLEIDVEEACLAALALYQPVATDLRFIVAVLKINSDLERIADLAVGIAEQACFIANAPKISNMPFDLGDEARKVRSMLRGSLDALVTGNAELAQSIRQQDPEIDSLHRDVYAHVEQAMQTHQNDVRALSHLLNISRRLERIADHAVNIAEDVIYMQRGHIVRHSPLMLGGSPLPLPPNQSPVENI